MKNDINIECTVTATSDEIANGIFKLATQRLLNVNTWNKLDGSLLSDCQLVDERGFKVNRNVHSNDYLQIHEDNNQSSESYKWIKVERVEESQSSEGSESIVLLARSSSNPWNYSVDVDKECEVLPGIISIVRKGLHVTASVYAQAQHEIEGNNVVDRMREISNVMYLTLGAYCVQWRSLVNAILGDLHEVDKSLA